MKCNCWLAQIFSAAMLEQLLPHSLLSNLLRLLLRLLLLLLMHGRCTPQATCTSSSLTPSLRACCTLRSFKRLQALLLPAQLPALKLILLRVLRLLLLVIFNLQWLYRPCRRLSTLRQTHSPKTMTSLPRATNR